MALGHTKRAVGTFRTRQAAEQALTDLRSSGFPMDRVSIVGKDTDRSKKFMGADVRDHHGNKADDGAKAGAVTGGTVGGVTGLLVGLGLLAIPGIGPVMLAGAAGTALATALSGGAIGAVAGGLGGALVGLGIPEREAKDYGDRVSRGEYLVVVDGSAEEIAQAEAGLRRSGVEAWRVYDTSATAATTTTTATAATTTASVNRSQTVATPVADASPRALSDDESVRLYEERLIADKQRVKTGEVALGKRVETETARVEVPVERERVVIERVAVDSAATVDPNTAFNQEVARVEVYEETADVRKEAFVREEVTLRKEVEHQMVDAQETLRREELDIRTEGHPVVDTTPDSDLHKRV